MKKSVTVCYGALTLGFFAINACGLPSAPSSGSHKPSQGFSIQADTVSDNPTSEKSNELTYDDEADLSDLSENNIDDLKKHNIVPGIISVVYANHSKVHLNKDGKSFKNKNNDPTKQVEAILDAFKVTSKSDLTYGMTEAEVMEDQVNIAKHFEGDIADRYSIHTYNFPEDTDIVKLLKILRSLPFVRSANPMYKSEVSYTKTHLSTISASTTAPAPIDPDFSLAETPNWWWFNRQQVFTGWNVYGSTPVPTIAVIDSGFDTTAGAFDKPNYLAGKSFTGCTGVAVGCSTGTNVMEPNSSLTESHGTIMASTIASPRNNTKLLSGIAPFSAIVPYRVDPGTPTGTNSIATAIRDAKNNANVDVINVSISAGNVCPLPLSSTMIRTEVASAFSAGKVVVFAVGNKHVSLQDSTNNPGCTGGDGGSIIVGGIDNDISVSPNRNKAWVRIPSIYTPSVVLGQGSNYDTNTSKIDIAAAAEGIRTADYNPQTQTSEFHVDGGTSYAAAMVSATAGMMRKLYKSQNPALTLTPAQAESILVASSSLGRYSDSSSTAPETKFIGKNLRTTSDYGGTRMPGVRSLNVHNALMMTKHLKQYQALVRIYNNDDYTQATVNNDWSAGNYIETTLGNDSIWGLGGLATGNDIVFRTQNVSGVYTYGRSYLRMNSSNVLTDSSNNFGGVQGVVGAENNATKPPGWYATTFFVDFN